MNELKQHYRISLKDIHATPADGIYVTKADARKLTLMGAALCILLGILSIFHGKK